MRYIVYNMLLIICIFCLSMKSNAYEKTACGKLNVSYSKTVMPSAYPFGNVFDIALNKDGSKAYVTNYSEEVIIVIDLTKDQPVNIKQINIPKKSILISNPQSIIYNKYKNEIYVLDVMLNNIFRIDCETDSIEILVEKIQSPQNIILSENGQLIYVCSEGESNQISIIDIGNREVIKQISIDNVNIDPYGMVIVDSTLYVVSKYDGAVYIVNLENDDIGKIDILTDAYDIIASYDKKKLFVTHNKRDGKLTIIDIETKENRNISVNANPTGMGIINNSLLVLSSIDNKLNIINTDTDELLSDIDLRSEGPQNLVVSPLKDQLYIANWGSKSVNIYNIEKFEIPDPPQIYSQTPINDKSPTWNWISGGDGNDIFRYKIDDNSFSIINKTEYTSPAELSEGFHTFYVQEQNDNGCWSESASITIEIDTGKPCSKVHSRKIVKTKEKSFSISYTYGDIYGDQDKCYSQSTGSGVTQIELWAKIPGNKNYEKIDTDINQNIDGFFQYTATCEGAYYFYSIAKDKAGNIENDKSDNIEANDYNSRTIYVNDFSGYAILAVGAIDDEEGIKPHTLTANKIYWQLVRRNFTLEDKNSNFLDDPLDLIKYYNPYTDKQKGEDEYSTPDHQKYYKEVLHEAITNWTFNKMMEMPGPLYLIFLGHGTYNTFYLDSALIDNENKVIKSSELKEWLNKLKDKMKSNGIDQKIIVFLGSCYSGSFIDDLSSENIIIITSSSANESSFRGPKESNDINDGDFFMTTLFSGLGNGLTLFDSFTDAVSKTSLLTDSNKFNRYSKYNDTVMQHPLLDDNGDNKGSNNLTNGLDGNKAKNIILGFNANTPESITITEIGYYPEIPVSYDSNLVEFWAKTDQQFSNTRMWIDIKKPDIKIERSKVQPIVELQRKYMSYNSENQRFEAQCDYFIDSGQYTIFFYAAYNLDDQTEIVSQPVIKHVYKQKQNNTPPERVQLIYPEDGFDQAQTKWLLKWKHSKDPDGDKVMYTLILSKSPNFKDNETIQFKELTTNSFFINLPTEDWDQSDIYCKVLAIDEFGLFHDSDNVVFQFITNNNNDKNTFFNLCVKDQYRNFYINNANINIDLKEKSKKFININGCYIIDINIINIINVENNTNPQKIEISIEAPNYHGLVQHIYTDKLEKSCNKDFYLTPLQIPCDINFDNNIDLSDAILFLQLFTGIHIYPQHEIQTINGQKKSRLNELVYIFERIINAED